MGLTSREIELLRLLQRSVPLVPRPWQQIADQLGLGVGDTLDVLKKLRKGSIIRRISGIFDATALGYRQVLVAFGVDGENLDSAGRSVAAHPGVGHAYSRDDSQYNLWFTLAVSPESSLGLEETVNALARQAKAKRQMTLPSLRRYKLDVRFFDDATRQPAQAVSPATSSVSTVSSALDESHRRAVVALQQDLPGRENPFAVLADEAGLCVDDLLVYAAQFQAGGLMRRYGAIVHHRNAGAKANVMAAWAITPSRADLAGAAAAGVKAVSHCYLRSAADDWPYTLYTMVHSHSKSRCLKTIEQIAFAIGNPDRRLLWTLSEYKKTPPKFFTRDEKQWEKQASFVD